MGSANVRWPVPLQRLTPWYPGQPGVPGTDSDRGLRLDSNGIVIYVDRNHVDNSDLRDGTDPDAPMSTVTAALTKCRAYMNDTIVVMHNSRWYDTDPTYARKLPVQENVVVTTPGVRIVGLAPSSTLGVPWLPGTTGGTCLTVYAFDVLVEGFNFMDMAANNATGIYAEWDGASYWGDALTVRNCYFNTYLDYGIRLDFCYYADIHSNYFHGVNVAAIDDVTVGNDSDYSLIHDNWFSYCVAAINLPGVGAAHIHHNTIHGNPAGANNYINLTGGADNAVHHNVLNCSLGAQYNTTCSDATSGSWIQNYCLNGPNVAPPT
jgi:hypothetical protein